MSSTTQISEKPVALICMGVSGCGKTTIAQALAEHFNFQFLDADDFHSEENKVHMAAGKPLTDAMRLPWVHSMREYVQILAQRNKSCTLAFSGLRAAHRKILRNTDMQTIYLYLKGSQQVILERMNARENHFMPDSLLDSQFDSMEDPTGESDVITVDINKNLNEILFEIYAMLEERQIK